jgi:hypothetical protein
MYAHCFAEDAQAREISALLIAVICDLKLHDAGKFVHETLKKPLQANVQYNIMRIDPRVWSFARVITMCHSDNWRLLPDTDCAL